MKQISVEMPVVTECDVRECAYNTNSRCHARAITVGDSVQPGCDTFLNAQSHAREKQRIAGVGACKVAACRHNDDFECMADQIAIGHVRQSVRCLTYQQR